jgi:hypothetical protein
LFWVTSQEVVDLGAEDKQKLAIKVWSRVVSYADIV